MSPSPIHGTVDNAKIALAPFRRTAFRNLWLATLLANLGAWAQVVGAGWLMLELAGRADLIAYVQAANSAPVLLLSLFAGALADIYERRSIQLGAQIWVLAGAILLAILAAWGAVSPMIVLALTFATGVGVAMRAPAWQASIRDLVADDDVAAAVTLSSVGFNLSRIVGPTVGGLIVAVSSPVGAFAFNVAVSMVLIVVLMRMPGGAARQRQSGAHIIAMIRGGLTYVLGAASMRTVLARAAAIGIPSSATLAILPALVRERLAGGPLQYGILLGCFGVGAVASAFVLPGWRRNRRPENLLSGASLVFAISLMALAFAASPALTALALIAGGFAWVVMLTMLNTSMQFAALAEFRGRALAAYMTCAFGGPMIGSILWGRLAYLFSIRTAFLWTGIVLAATILLRLRFALPDMQPRGEAPKA